MSAQSAKKKRIGSRRRVANQNKTSEADEIHITDSNSVAQHNIPEENTDSLNVSANPDSSRCESPNPPSPELSGNRRKLGSSRRNKGGQSVKDSAESYHKPREEVEEKTRDDETPQTTQMSLAIQPQRQEELSQGSEHDIMSVTHDRSYLPITPDHSSEIQYSTTNCPEAEMQSVETMLQGTTKSDTLQCEELKENAHLVCNSELTTLNVLSCPTVDQQLISQSNSRDIPDEELHNVYSVTEKESKEGDKSTGLVRQDGNLQGNSSVSESHAKSVVTRSSITPEITADKSIPRESTELEYSVEQPIFSSPNKEFESNDEEQNEHFSLSEVNSEDTASKMHEQEVKRKVHETDHSSESVIHDDAAEKSEVISGDLIDQAEIRDTCQSELVVKSTDDSATKQKDSNPDDQQDEHPTKENNFRAFKHTNEDYQLYNTKIPQINDIERVDTALDQVYEAKGRLEDDKKPTAEQTDHQEKEGILSEDKESDSSLQTLQTEIDSPLDSQPQQNDTNFKPIENRRKLGASRRNKGRQQVKETDTESYHEHKEVGENPRGKETLETTQILVEMETTSQEELSQESEHDVIMPATHDNSLYSAIMPGCSSEVQDLTTTNYPEADLDRLTPKSESLQEDHDERETDFKKRMKGMDKCETLQSQEVIGAHHSEDAVNKVHEQEVNPTQIHKIDHSSQSVTDDAPGNSEIISGDLIDQAEIRDTCQSVLVVKSTDDYTTKQDGSNPDEQSKHPSKESNFEALENKNEDNHIYDTKKLQISNMERVDTVLGQVYDDEGQVEDDLKSSTEQTGREEKERIFSEMEESESSLQTLQSETNIPLDSQPLDNSVGIEEQIQTGFNSFGNRRKLGASRKNKGQQLVKESVAELQHEHKEEVVESTAGNEALETTQMFVAIERMSQEELSQETEHDVIIPVTHDSSLDPAIMPGCSSEIQNPTTTNDPEADLESLILKSETLQEDHDEREADFKVEVSDKSVGATLEGMDKCETLQSQDVRGAHLSEDAVNKAHEQEVKPTEVQEIDHSSESVTDDATEHYEIIPGNLTDHAEDTDIHQSELIVKSTDDSASKQGDLNPDEKQDEHPTEENNFEASEQTNEDYHDTKKLHISGIERVDTALGQMYEGEDQEDDIKPSVEQTIHQEEEGIFSEMEESESSLQTLQSETNIPLDSQTLDYSVTIDEQTHTGFNPIGNRRKLGSSRRHKGRRQIKESVGESYHENKEEIVESTRGKETVETKHMFVAIERTSQEELSQETEHDIVMPVAHDSSLDPAIMPGCSSEIQNPTTTNDPEADLESLIPKSETLQEDHDERETDFKVEVSDKSVGATLEGMDKCETLQSQEVIGAHHSEDAVNKVHEQEVNPTQIHKIDHSSQSVTDDAPGNSEIISGDLIDQAEIRDTCQSVLVVKSPDDYTTKQDGSNPDEQSKHPSKESNFEALENKNEDNHIYDTKKLQISNMERVDTVLGQVYDDEGQVEDDIKSSTEQTGREEKERIFSEMEESESSLQTLQSETNIPLDSQPLDNSVGIEEQIQTGFNSFGNRRKLGSSRRNKGQQLVKESVAELQHEHKEDVVESTAGNEALETTQMLVAIERMSQEELSQETEHDVIIPVIHDSSLDPAIMPGCSSEIQNPTTTNDPEADLESLIPKSETLQEDHDERETDFKVEVSDKSVGATLEGMDKCETLQSQDVRGAHLSEDAVNKAHEQEVKPPEVQEIDHSSESVTDDATEHYEIIPGNLTDHAEDTDIHQSELIVKSTDDSASKQGDLNPDEKQDEHPTEENNFEASEQTNEDYHDTKKLHISGIERVDTALGQMYEGEDQEDDIKPSVEQTVHQEEEGIFSEMEESESSLQTLQSETNIPLDSQTLDNSVTIEEQTHAGFNSIGNRRKLGSSRRNKGRRQIKESVGESYHENKEEIVESTRGKETVETKQMFVAIERTSQEELSQETEHDIVMPVAHDSSLDPAIMPGCSSEIQNPTTTNYPEADLESLTPKSETLQEDHDERETDFKVEVSDKSVGATLEGMDKCETLQSQDVRGAHLSEDAVNKVHEQEVKSTQVQEINHSSESVTHDTTENSEIIPGNLTDHAEDTDTYQLIVKSTDDSATKQEDLNPDDKQDEHPTKENNFEASEQTNEDYHDTKKLHISGIERVDTALGQMYEGEDQEDDIKPSVEQTVHQEEEGIFSKMEESESSLQTLQSETNIPLDSQTLDYSVTIEEQTHTGFNPIGNRRKLGSSRRHKGRRQIKESVGESYHENKEEIVESTRGKETVETKQMFVAIERTSQEELSQESEHDIVMPVAHDSSLDSAIMPGCSSEIQNPTTTNYPEADLDSLIPKSETLQEDHDERETDFKVEVSDKSVGATLEGMDKCETLQSQEVRGAHLSEDAVNKAHEQEVKPTQVHEIDHLSESVTHDATENSEIMPGNLTDHAEDTDIHQSELIVKSTDDSASKQGYLNPNDKKDEHPTKENNFEASEQTNEDYHDTKKLHISGIERTDTALGQMYEGEDQVEDDIKPSVEQTVHQEKEGIFSEMEESESSLQTLQSETNAPLDSELQQNNTNFNPLGNRRKLGSSRRNKGRQHAKDSECSYHTPTEEVVGNTRDKELLETTNMSIETAAQENSMETMLEHAEAECSIEQAISSSPIEGLSTNEEQNEHFNLSEVKDAQHSEDAVNKVHEQEVKPTQIHEIDHSSESVSHDAAENSEIISGNRIDQAEDTETYQSELIVKGTNECTTKQEDSNPYDKYDEHPTKETNFEALQSVDSVLGLVYEIEGQVEEDIKSRAEQTVHQENEGLLSEMVESDSSLQTLLSEIHAPLDSQPQQNDTNFNPIGNRRKLGSSRRNKARHHAKDYVAESYQGSTEESVRNTRDNKLRETIKMSSTIETEVQKKSMETMLEGMDMFDTAQTGEVSDEVTENAPVGISELTTSILHSSLKIDQQLINQSNSTEMPEEELPNLYCVTEKESKARDEDTESFSQNGNLKDNYLDIESSISTEKSSPGEHTDTKCSVEQAEFSSSKEELTANEEQKEHVNLCQVRGSLHAEDLVNEVHEDAVEPTQMQEVDKIDFSSIKESESILQPMQSELNAPLDSHPQDKEEHTHTGFNPIGNRRKLGSSRRNKGRLHVKDSVLETYHEPKEFVENIKGDEALGTSKMSSEMETMKQEELKMQTDLDLDPAQKIRKTRSTVNDEGDTEKMPEEDTILSQNVASTIVTTDITSSSGKDPSVKSNEEEKNLLKEPENLSQLTGHDTVKMDSIQSPEDDSDIQSISYHDDNVSTRPVATGVLEQEDAHEVKKTEALSCDKDSLGQEKTNLDSSENLQGKSKQKRRKMGSTRRSQLNWKPEGGMDDKDETNESDFNLEADMKNVDKMAAEEESPIIITAEVSQTDNVKPSLTPANEEQQETNETSAVRDKGQKLQSSCSDSQSLQSNIIPDIDYLAALLPWQSASHNENVVNPVQFVKVADIKDRERNVDVNMELSHVDITSVLAERKARQNYEERSESANKIQDQTLKSAEAPVVAVADLEIVKSVVSGGAGEEHKDARASIQEPNNVNEAHNKNLEVKDASPDLNSPNRRRKMGSTRRNLGSRRKEEDLHQKQEVYNEAMEAATNVDVKTDSFPSIKVKEELQLHNEDKDSDSEQRKEKVFETVEYSHTGESHFKPPSHQTTEENPVSHDQLVEMEHQLTPIYLPAIPSTSPKHDEMSETAGGRRRKMGSHRKSRGHQNNENQTAKGDRITDAQHGREVRSITDESAIKTTEEESLGLDKISEVDESDMKTSSNISASKAGEHSRPVSEKTVQVNPFQHPYAEIQLGQESQKTLSLAGSSRGEAPRSNSYNVMMVGDSSVGKTSFMRRAQSGKFSLDLPASVGLDSCMWTVVVDGKPVVLQLWDTAGQERFHSITRQIFHKAQAFLLMYDITCSQSFTAISYWANCIQEGAAENVTILLLGNKSDHAERQVKTHEGEILAKEYNFEFMECSAATGENVIQSLETVARMLSQRADKQEETTVLHKESQQRKSSGCC